MKRRKFRLPSSNAWLLSVGALALALFASYVHMLSAAVERAQAPRQAPAAPSPPPQAATIPDSHLAFIVVP